jgi:hypothetical protein
MPNAKRKSLETGRKAQEACALRRTTLEMWQAADAIVSRGQWTGTTTVADSLLSSPSDGVVR